MANWKPEGWHSITTRLFVGDPAHLVTFLQRSFGAAGEYESECPSELLIGDSHVMVSGTEVRKPTSAFFYLYVEDADEAFRLAMANGAICVQEPRTVPYGDRRAMIEDPAGNTWQIATRLRT